MYEVLCERCWHTEPIGDDGLIPAKPCPGCGETGTWVGPYVDAPQRFSRRDAWPLLTSSQYKHAGQTERRSRPRA